MPRHDGRANDELRPVSIERGFIRNSAGSVLYRAGKTTLIVTAQISEKVPPFLEGKGVGWLTAEYAMLPGSTPTRKSRGPDGRATEIQRLIGRSLRACSTPKRWDRGPFMSMPTSSRPMAAPVPPQLPARSSPSRMPYKASWDRPPQRGAAGQRGGRQRGPGRWRAGARPRLSRGFQRPRRHECRPSWSRRIRRGARHGRIGRLLPFGTQRLARPR